MFDYLSRSRLPSSSLPQPPPFPSTTSEVTVPNWPDSYLSFWCKCPSRRPSMMQAECYAHRTIGNSLVSPVPPLPPSFLIRNIPFTFVPFSVPPDPISVIFLSFILKCHLNHLWDSFSLSGRETAECGSKWMLLMQTHISRVLKVSFSNGSLAGDKATLYFSLKALWSVDCT